MLYWCNLDESSDGQQKDVFVAAGFIASGKTWTAIRKPWKSKLKEHGLEYFKSNECRNLQKQFHNYKREFGLEEGHRRANAIRNELEKIVLGAEVYGFVMGINLQEFWQVNDMSEAKHNPHWSSDYFVMAYRMIFYKITQEIKAQEKHNYVAFICDKSNNTAKLDSAYQGFKKRYPILAQYMRGISHLDD